MEKEIKTDQIGARPKRKWNDTILILYILTFVLMTVGQMVGGLLCFAIPVKNPSAVYTTSLVYGSFIGIWIIMLPYLRFTKKNRFILQELGTKTTDNSWKLFVAGLFIGFASNGICILAAWLHEDIKLVFDSFQPVSFLFLFICVLIQSSAEELVCRGFLYQRLRKSYQHPAVAIIGNSALFAIMHLMNPGVTVLPVINILLFGLLFSLIVYYTSSIWCAIAAHTAWNFMQNIIFGLPNSGMVLPYSVFKLDAETATNSFAYNVEFGIEGTVFALLVGVITCMILWGINKKKKSGNPQPDA